MKHTNINFKTLKLVYLIMILITIILCSRIKDNMYDISRFEPQIEYFNIHTSGGFSSHDTDLMAYIDGGHYYLEFNDNMSNKPDNHVKYELSKTEYLLCTNIDVQTLEKYPGDWGNDMPEETLTIKEKDKEEIVIEKKIYADYSKQNFGLCRQIYDMKQKVPEGKINYDTYLKLASYLYSNGTNFAWLRTGNCIFRDVGSSFNDICINKKYVRTPDDLKKMYSNLNYLFKEPKTEKGAKNKEELLKKFIQTDHLGSKTYYSEVVSESEESLGFIMASPERGDTILYYSDIPENVQPEQYFKDVLSIIEGKSAGRTAKMIALSAETALFIAAMFFAVKKSKWNTRSINSRAIKITVR